MSWRQLIRAIHIDTPGYVSISFKPRKENFLKRGILAPCVSGALILWIHCYVNIIWRFVFINRLSMIDWNIWQANISFRFRAHMNNWNEKKNMINCIYLFYFYFSKRLQLHPKTVPSDRIAFFAYFANHIIDISPHHISYYDTVITMETSTMLTWAHSTHLGPVLT